MKSFDQDCQGLASLSSSFIARYLVAGKTRRQGELQHRPQDPRSISGRKRAATHKPAFNLTVGVPDRQFR